MNGLKSNFLCLALMALMPLSVLGQTTFDTYKRPLIIGIRTAVTALLTYAAYKRWVKDTIDKEDILTKVEKEINKDVGTFLELLWVFNYSVRYNEIYNTTSDLYDFFKEFLDKYSPSWWHAIRPPNTALITSLKHLQKSARTGDTKVDKRHSEYNNKLEELKQSITQISALITKVIKTQINQSTVTKIIQQVSGNRHADKIDPDLLEDFINDLITAVTKFNTAFKALSAGTIRLEDSTKKTTLTIVENLDIKKMEKESENTKLALINLLLMRALPQLLEEIKGIKGTSGKSTFSSIMKETLGSKIDDIYNYLARTSSRFAVIPRLPFEQNVLE